MPILKVQCRVWLPTLRMQSCSRILQTFRVITACFFRHKMGLFEATVTNGGLRLLQWLRSVALLDNWRQLVLKMQWKQLQHLGNTSQFVFWFIYSSLEFVCFLRFSFSTFHLWPLLADFRTDDAWYYTVREINFL